MTRELFTPDELLELHRRYQAGESSVDLAKSLGCHSSTIRNAFDRAGLAKRSFSEAKVVEAARLTPEARRLRASAAHAAVRGSRQTDAHRERIALTRSQRIGGQSKSELRAALWLRRHRIEVQPQAPLGRYNIDILAGGSVAVEIFGGHWHGKGRHAARHQERTRHLLDSGFDVVIVWVDQKHGERWIRGLQEVVSLLELRRRDPSAPRQYRVVWGDGDVVLALDDQADNFPFKPAFEVLRDSGGRYHRA